MILFAALLRESQAFHLGKMNDGRSQLRQSMEVYLSSRNDDESKGERRRFLGSSIAAVFATTLTPSTAMARYVLDEETGDYVEVEDVDWQTAWKQRMDKASSMSTDEIFQAARGAGNVDLRSGPESDASRKRRAMSSCRDATIREKAGVGTEKECTARVLMGDIDIVLDSV